MEFFFSSSTEQTKALDNRETKDPPQALDDLGGEQVLFDATRLARRRAQELDDGHAPQVQSAVGFLRETRAVRTLKKT